MRKNQECAEHRSGVHCYREESDCSNYTDPVTFAEWLRFDASERCRRTLALQSGLVGRILDAQYCGCRTIRWVCSWLSCRSLITSSVVEMTASSYIMTVTSLPQLTSPIFDMKDGPSEGTVMEISTYFGSACFPFSGQQTGKTNRDILHVQFDH